MTGAMGWAVTAASRSGDGGPAAKESDGRAERPGGVRVQAVSDLGEIAPVCVSEGGLELPEIRTQWITAGFIRIHSELRVHVIDHLPGRHPAHRDSSAPVSRQVSRRAYKAGRSCGQTQPRP